MANNRGSSADLLIHVDFCVEKYWNACQYYEEDETMPVTEQIYSKSSCSTQLHYYKFFRVDAYKAISQALVRLGVDSDHLVQDVDAMISKAQQVCVNNVRKADHTENRIMYNMQVFYGENLVDDERQGVQQTMEDHEDEGMVPAALSAIGSLGASRIKVERGKKAEQCMVCLEEYCNGEKVTCMPCSHMFHRDCITKWLLKSHLCPVCRFEMPKYS